MLTILRIQYTTYIILFFLNPSPNQHIIKGVIKISIKKFFYDPMFNSTIFLV